MSEQYDVWILEGGARAFWSSKHDRWMYRVLTLVASQRLLAAFNSSNLFGDAFGLLVDSCVRWLKSVDFGARLFALFHRSLHVEQQLRFRQQRAALTQVAILLNERVLWPLHCGLSRPLLYMTRTLQVCTGRAARGLGPYWLGSGIPDGYGSKYHRTGSQNIGLLPQWPYRRRQSVFGHTARLTNGVRAHDAPSMSSWTFIRSLAGS